MTDQQPRRRRQADPAAMRRSGLDAIGADLAARVPPPIPPGLGEGLLDQARHPRSPPMSDGFEHGDAGARERILVTLARIEERQGAMLRSNDSAQAEAAARHTNLMSTMATFMPRSEVEKDNKALNGRIDELEGRLLTVEKRIWGAVAAILSSVLAAIAGVFGIVVKHG